MSFIINTPPATADFTDCIIRGNFLAWKERMWVPEKQNYRVAWFARKVAWMSGEFMDDYHHTKHCANLKRDISSLVWNRVFEVDGVQYSYFHVEDLNDLSKNNKLAAKKFIEAKYSECSDVTIYHFNADSPISKSVDV